MASEELSIAKSRCVEELAEALREAEERYAAANPVSAELFEGACRYLPGGNTRATVYFAPFPLTLTRAEGANLWDADGNVYLDFLGDYTADVYGHNPEMLERILAKVRKVGISLSGPTEYEARLSALICERIPSCEQVRFCNSGTEANIYATTLARRFTGRETILVFDGGYHGGALVFEGQGPLNIQIKHIRSTYNDIELTRTKIREAAGDLAAVVLEPMMGAAGCIPADLTFLQMLREETERLGILLIFDEVMNSRLAPNGLQGFYGIRPDLTTLGKYMGGGFSFGAFGGRADVMALLDIRNPGALPHSGTFCNNVTSMIGGTIGLSHYYTPEACIAVNERGARLRSDLNEMARGRDVPVFVSGLGGVMNLHFGTRPLRSPADIPEKMSAGGPSAAPTYQLRRLLHLHLLAEGFYTASRGLITISMAIRDAHVADLKRAVEAFFERHDALIRKVVAEFAS